MTNDGKENIRHVTCTNHATRSDRDFIRVCPSKLSKRELEDLYFSLLENNTQMKKTINGQRDQIKLLTTKVNRMTVQKNALGNLNKDCCAGIKAIINEQKESIAELKTANERLSDRIRLLNMRLCSAKQFLRRSSAQSTTRCTKCSLTPNQSVKNSSMSALNTRASDANLPSHTEVTGSCQVLNKESSTIKPDVMQTSQSEMKDEPCQQNKCRTMMDELKQKIENLEQELSKTHEQYCERMRKLEEQMRELRSENSRVRVLQAESDHRLEVEQKKAGEMLHKLRDAEMQRDNLATELQIEKSKVSELETQVRAADISSQVAEALEKHLKNNMTHRRASTAQNKSEPSSLELCASEWNYNPPILVPHNSEKSRIEESDQEIKVTKSSDDSGYAEKLDDIKDLSKTDQHILEKIASLQAQLNNLKHSMNENDKRDDLKSNVVEPLQESKLESTKTYAAMDANSSLSNDIFQTLKIKDVDQRPSTVQAPEILISVEDINKSPKTSAVESLNKFDPRSKLQILSPLPVDVPRMPYFGEISKNSVLSDAKQNENNISDTSFKKHLNQNRNRVHGGDENENININDYEKNSNYLNKEETADENDYYKKRRRSSLKNPNQDRVKDLSVSYDQKNIILGSSINIVDKDEKWQGNGNGKVIRALCQSDNEPNTEYKVNERNVKKKIRYEKENFHTAPRNETYLDKGVSENDLDNNKIEKDYSATPYTKENLDNLTRGIQNLQGIDPISTNVASPVGTSSGNSTYTVEGKRAQSKSNKDATYQIESKNEDTACQVQTGNNHLDVCQGYARICTCPRIPHRDISVFRTCSGTSRFKTTPSTKNKFRQCPCMRDSKTDVSGIAGPKPNHLMANQSRMPQPLNSSTPNQKKTYNVKGSAEVVRSTSPDSTDHEISSLTDLPNEAPFSLALAKTSSDVRRKRIDKTKCHLARGADSTDHEISSLTDLPNEEKSPRDYISPGEEKATSTFSDSYAAATTTDYGSLSLGEVPVIGAKKLSEVRTRDRPTDSIALSTTSYKMEEALQAISEELTRCRELLQGQLPAQKFRLRDNSSTTEEAPIELHRAEGKPRISGVLSPKCIFTLHVGTVVLSDQAVMCSRGKALALTWQFYDQSATMSRLLAGRVMHFDFSTEYDLRITDHFLHYLKHEELPIIICEMDKQDEAFASCTLPLRDALLHTNRRVDMSLALVGGPQLLRQLSTNELEWSEEVGVLDVWCLLRVEPGALGAINSAIVTNQSPQRTAYRNKHRSSLMDQILDDEQAVKYRYSQDLRVRRTTPRSSEYPNFTDEVADTEKNPSSQRSGPEAVIEAEVPTKIKSIDDTRQAVGEQSSDASSIYDILKSKKWRRRRSSSSKETRPESRQKSVSYDPKLPIPQDSSDLVHKEDNVEILSNDDSFQSIEITVLWLALNEDCKAMSDPAVKKLYVAYSFLGRSGADLETPCSLPKPKHYMDKLHFMFKKTFTLNECDLPLLGHLARCRQPTAGNTASASDAHDPKHCIVFSVVSEPPEDPLGLDNCEDVGFAYLYLGDVLAYSGGAEQHTAIVSVHTAGHEEAVCGAIAVKVDGLSVLRRCIALSYSDRSFENCETGLIIIYILADARDFVRVDLVF